MLKTPFVIYADFESLIIPISTTFPNQNTSYSVKTQQHDPICYAFFVISADKKIVFHTYYLGLDCVEHFLKTLQRIEKMLSTYLMRNVPMVGGTFDKSSQCYVCKKSFRKGDIVVRDHSHLTGKFRGFCCSSPCNLNLKESPYIPIVIHNLTGYDGKLIFKRISNVYAKKIKVIPINNEKFTTFTIDNLKFLDSFNFLSTSLANLVDSLNISGYHFPILNEYFTDKRKCDLLKRKGVFPYSWLTSMDKLKETKLPERIHFFNDLTREHITEVDYEFAKKIWKKFKCKTIEDYLKLYLFTDCLLLADVFDSFRDIAMKVYQLEVLNFISAADLTWSACLKFTNCTLELITDIDMYLTIEHGIRGGICVAPKRFSRANNKYLPDSYNPNIESKYIVNLDVLNLYGFCMTAYLPHSNFKWLTENEIQNFDIHTVPPDSDVGYILVVSLIYPSHLHDKTNSFALACDHIEIKYSDLSSYQQTLLNKFNMKYTKTKKLVPNLRDKENYVVHYLNLQYYLKQGLILKKIHKIISFHQSPFLKPYIDLNSHKRKNANGTFYKNFYKLMVNSFFGRCLLNVRKLRNISIATTKKECRKHLQSATTDYFQPINENCVLFKKKRTTLNLNRPIAIGFTILDLAKLHMYRMYYDVFKKTYGNNVELVYTDTDSLVLEIKCKDLYKDFKNKLPNIFDFSNYEKSHFLYDESNKMKIGLLKDETSGIPVREICCLKCKMYSIVFGNECKKTGKGVKNSVLKDLTHDTYVKTLENDLALRNNQYQILSKNYTLNTFCVNKISLSSFDDKYFRDGDIYLAHGHYKLQNMYDSE